MTPEQVFGKLNKDIKGLTSGVASASVSGSSIIFTMNDGSTQTITFPQPKDGASIVSVSTNENNQFVFSMSDGTEIVGGEVPASSGVSKEYVDSELSKKANNSDIPTKVSGLQNDSNYQTDTDVATSLTPYAKSADVTKEITNKVAEIIADAPEDFNTLKEMSDWISNHENDASAMNSAISDNKTTITALQTDKADKSEIPTTLPANGGNADTVNGHTVNSDVPENAVFTDTVYDDTKIKYGETAGGKNLFKGNFIEKVLDTGINYTDVDLSKEQNTIKDIKGITFATFGAYLKKGTYTFSYTNDAYFSLNRVAIAGTDCVLAIDTIRKSYTWTQNVDGWTYFGIEGDDSETGVTDTPFSVTPDIQIEKGAQATAYETYIPSIKMLEDEVSEQNDSLSVIGKCKNLLNPTLQTTTQNGVTCTNNGDGTYTLNGTASSDIVLALESYKSYTGKEKFRLVGCPNGGGESKYYLAFRPNNAEENRKDIGSGVTFNDLSTSNKYAVAIIVLNGTTVTNLTFKPMLTENLNATYDDFVPYTGDGETLASDVAELKNDLVPKKKLNCRMLMKK